MTTQPNESWITGKYENGEADWSYSTLAVKEPEWFMQGEDADRAIQKIHQYWLMNEVTQEEAFDWYVITYLI